MQADDLSASVGIPTPTLPPQVTDTVLVLLTRLAVHRHGPTAVLRALSRAERAPTTIAAFDPGQRHARSCRLGKCSGQVR